MKKIYFVPNGRGIIEEYRREYYRIIEKIILELNKNILLYPETIILDINTDLIITDDLFKNLFNKIQNQINICKISHNYMYI